jgi:hypothetical protein
MCNKKLLSSISALTVILTTAGCIESETHVSNNEYTYEQQIAQSRQYANSFQQYSMLSSQLVTNSAAWEVGQYAAAAGVIDIAALGGDLGSAENIIESAYCITDPADPIEATHITWFKSQSDDDFILKGLGKSATSNVMGQLAGSVGGMALATYLGDGNLLSVNGSSIETLPAGCHFDEITVNSPILVTKMALPRPPEDVVTRTEYSAGTCATGQTGHKLYSADVSYRSDGSFTVGGVKYKSGDTLPATSDSKIWTLVSDSCKDPLVTATMETVAATMSGASFSGGAIVGSGAVKNTIDSNIGEIACRKAAKFEIATASDEVDAADAGDDIVEDTAKTMAAEESKADEGEFFKFHKNGKHYFGRKKRGKKHVFGFFEGGHKYKFRKNKHGKNKAYKIDWTSKKYKIDDRAFDEFTTDIVAHETSVTEDDFKGVGGDDTTITSSYSTCTDTTEIEAVENAGDVRVDLDRIENHTTPCGGSAGSFTDVVNGFSGQVSHPIWTGDATYYREVYAHNVTNIMNASTNREITERWIGDTISCDRVEDLNITCNTSNPALSSFDLLDSTGFNYRRTNRIRGWANAESATPNDPQNPTWNFRADASGCEWREEDTWGCSVGDRQTRTGRRDRDYTVASLGGAASVSGWTTRQSARCEDDRIVSASCPTGENGTRTIKERRVYTSNTPGSGSWSGWSYVEDEVNTCQSPSSGSNGGNDNSCLLAGAKVLMADGSTKNIENVQIGEKTAAGRVLQKYQRLLNNGFSQSSIELFKTGGGLFEHDGVVATGRHPLYLNGQWKEMGEHHNLVNPIEGTQDTLVYNLLTEDHVIPIVGNSGTIYAYADELNNIHDTAQKGRIKNINLFGYKEQERA